MVKEIEQNVAGPRVNGDVLTFWSSGMAASIACALGGRSGGVGVGIWLGYGTEV